jgi:hypothetical protein
MCPMGVQNVSHGGSKMCHLGGVQNVSQGGSKCPFWGGHQMGSKMWILGVQNVSFGGGPDGGSKWSDLGPKCAKMSVWGGSGLGGVPDSGVLAY